MIEEQEEVSAATDWEQIPALVNSDLGLIIAELESLKQQEVELKVKIEAAREKVAPLAQKHEGSIKVHGTLLRWQEKGAPTWRLTKDSEKKMVQDGVTPDQLKKWKVRVEGRKAGLVICLPGTETTGS